MPKKVLSCKSTVIVIELHAHFPLLQFIIREAAKSVGIWEDATLLQDVPQTTLSKFYEMVR